VNKAQTAKKPDLVDRRRIFVETAYRIIASRGFAQTTLFDVASEAGFTTGALTHYFKTKDELLIATCKYMDQLASATVERKIRENEGFEAFWRVVHWQVTLEEEQTPLWSTAFTAWERSRENPLVAEAVHISSVGWRAQLMQMLADAQARDEIPHDIDLEKAAHGVNALIEGICVRSLISKNDPVTLDAHKIVDAWVAATLKPRGKAAALKWVEPAAPTVALTN